MVFSLGCPSLPSSRWARCPQRSGRHFFGMTVVFSLCILLAPIAWAQPQCDEYYQMTCPPPPDCTDACNTDPGSYNGASATSTSNGGSHQSTSPPSQASQIATIKKILTNGLKGGFDWVINTVTMKPESYLAYLDATNQQAVGLIRTSGKLPVLTGSATQRVLTQIPQSDPSRQMVKPPSTKRIFHYLELAYPLFFPGITEVGWTFKVH